MIVELLKSDIRTRQISDEYGLDTNMINRWRREHESKMGDFSKRRELSLAWIMHKLNFVLIKVSTVKLYIFTANSLQ